MPRENIRESLDLQDAEIGDEPILQSFRINAAWRNTWLRAIAHAWRDKEYKAKLLSKDKSAVHAALGEVGFPADTFFRDLLTIRVVEYKGKANYEYKPGTNGWGGFGADLGAVLTLVLPPEPPKNDELAMAIADYEAGGRIYPFTFC